MKKKLLFLLIIFFSFSAIGKEITTIEEASEAIESFMENGSYIKTIYSNCNEYYNKQQLDVIECNDIEDWYISICVNSERQMGRYYSKYKIFLDEKNNLIFEYR